MVSGPAWTQRSYQQLSNIFEDLNMAALSRETLAYALADDHCDLQRCPLAQSPATPRQPAS